MALVSQTELKKAQARKKAAEKEVRPLLLDPNFPKQNAFVNDTGRNIVAQCSRRSGKTNGLALRFFQTMAKYPKSKCLYLGLTQDSAREIMWPVLQELNEKYKLGCTFTESTMVMKHPNGARLKLMGADLKNFIKRLRGQKWPGVAVDEAQDFGSHLQSLIDDVLTPATADYPDGWIALTGTPGPVPHGYFFEITQQRRYDYSVHEWTLLDNPYMPEPAKFIEELKRKREWDEENPTLLREYRNKWVLDVQSLWIQYKERLNHYETLPTAAMTYAIGVDIGFKDADAWGVIGWTDHSSDIYLVEEVIRAKQGITEMMEMTQALIVKYKPIKVVIDEGGLGKKIAEEMRRRHAIPVHPADKARKQENVELINDQMRLGRFKAQKDSRFALDSYLVQIDWDKSTPSRIVIKKKPHSDIIDAVLYAFKESPAWNHTPIDVPPPYGSKEWALKEQEKMREAALSHFEEMAAAARDAANYGYND